MAGTVPEAYATMHPWGEDWAETWAHYLHVVDSLATALSFGLERSMGQADFYLFVMSTPVVAKLQLVHLVVFNAQSRPAQGEITQAATA